MLSDFWNKIEISNHNDDECWYWTGCKNKQGYGQIFRDGKSQLTHRYSYEYFKNKIPVGLSIDHLCRNRSCVNPNHLEPVTMKENSRRSPIIGRHGKSLKGKDHYLGMKTHCLRGHEFTFDNTIRYNGKRKCRICNNRNAVLNQRKKKLLEAI